MTYRSENMQVLVGWVRLASAVIDRAESDISGSDLYAMSPADVADAEDFLRTDWCTYLRQFTPENLESFLSDVIA